MRIHTANEVVNSRYFANINRAEIRGTDICPKFRGSLAAKHSPRRSRTRSETLLLYASKLGYVLLPKELGVEVIDKDLLYPRF